MLNNDISLLQYITSNEVNDLIIENELDQEDYSFKYFIDNYDISRYSFPMGLLPKSDYDNKSELPIEIITDEQLSYHYIIDKEDRFYLFDEHIEELNQFIRKINWVENSAERRINALEEFLVYFDNKKRKFKIEELKEKISFIKGTNISLIISIALGALYDGKKKIINLRKKLKINLEEDGDRIQNFDEIISCRPTEKSELIFDRLFDKTRTYEINRAISRYNNCKVYERLVCINNKTKQKKQLYFLLSSAKTLSDKIPKIASSLGLSVNIKDKIFNPIRTVSQIYLKLLLSNQDNKLNLLKTIKEIVLLKERDENIKEEVDRYLLDFFKNRLTDLREQFENVSLLLNVHNYREDLEEARTKQILIPNRLFIKSLNDLLENAKNTKNELIKNQELYLSEIKYLREYSIILKDALIGANKRKLSGFSGQDYIDSPFHSLPFVFFNKSNSNFIEIINDIIKLITETHTGKVSSKSLLQSIKTSFQLLFEKPMAETTDEEKIIMILILLMLRKDNELKPNEIAFSWINDTINKKMYSDDWYNDFLYMQSWIARRIKKYDKAVEIAKKGLDQDSNDPRFYQSLSLNYYCLFKESGKIEDLENAIDNSLKAYKKYIERLHENGNVSIKKSIIALLNSLSYQYSLKYSISEEKELLIKSREYLNELKKSCEIYYCNYHFSAEFQHTEAFLEYQEYISTGNKYKLCYSLTRIKKAKEIVEKHMYFELEDKILREINRIKLKCKN